MYLHNFGPTPCALNQNIGVNVHTLQLGRQFMFLNMKMEFQNRHFVDMNNAQNKHFKLLVTYHRLQFEYSGLLKMLSVGCNCCEG